MEEEALQAVNTEEIPTENIEEPSAESEDVLTEKPPKTRIIGIIFAYLAAPLVSVAAFTCFLIYLKIYPYGSKMMSSYDLLAQIVPFAEHLFDVIEGRSSLFYSFSVAYGADLFGSIAYCLVSPFTFIFLLGGKGMAVYMTPFVIGAKIVFICLSASFAVRKLFPKISPYIVPVLSVLYAFSGYFHVANTYINWLDFMIYMPLAVYAFARFMRTGKYLLFSAMIAAMIYACFSIACFSLIIIFLILFAYVLFVVEKEMRKEKITKICMSLIVAVAFALPIIAPAFMAYVNSGRNTGLFSKIYDKIDAEHLYSKLSYVFGDTVFFICGAFYFIICDKKNRKNLFLFIAGALILAPVLVDEICLLLNAGSYMSYSLRFGFLNSVYGLYITCSLVERVRAEKVNKTYKWPVSCIIGVVLLAMCVGALIVAENIADHGKDAWLFKLSAFKEGTPVYKMFEAADFGESFSSKFAHSLGGLEIIGITAITLAFATAVALTLAKLKFMPVKAAAAVLVAVALMQTGFNFYHTVEGDRNTMITYDQIQVVLDEIYNREGNTEQFKIKDYNNKVSADAPLTLHYRSVSIFSSVTDGGNFAPTDFFGYTGNGINTIKTRGGNVFSDSLFGYKYAYSTGTSISQDNWTKIETYGPFTLFENECAFPSAFTIPSGEYSVNDLSYADALDSLYGWLGGEGNLVSRLNPTKTEYFEEDDHYKFTFQTSASIPGNCYIIASIPGDVTVKYCNSSSYDEATAKTVDEKFRLDSGYRTRPYGVITVKVASGEISADDLADSFQLITISYDKVKELAATVNARAADVKFGRNTIATTVDANEGESLFVNYLAIKGYRCKINGKPVNLTKNDLGYLSVKLGKGRNEVVFEYSSPYVKYIIFGTVVGAIFAAAMILAFEYYEKIKKVFEKIADLAADILAAFIFGFGFCYPLFVFLEKCVRAVFGL